MKYMYASYSECITNIAGSIEKYFNVECKHGGIEYLDKLLEIRKPKNVVVILYDGMGYNLLHRNLSEDSFLVKNCIKPISSVVPATTTASTTSIRSGLYPNEHGWLGWDLYVKPIDKIVTMFTNKLKDTDIDAEDYSVTGKYFKYKSVVEKINEKEYFKAYSLFPFGENNYKDIDDMCSRIKSLCKEKGMKYIYAYYEDPDHTMHHTGTDSVDSLDVFKLINEKTEELCKDLEDTVVIVTADHGHINSDCITLSEYDDLFNLLDGDVSIEGRLCSFKVKDGYKDEFIKLFNNYFSEYFILKTKQEVLDMRLFGDSLDNHELFIDSLGDFIAIGKSNKYFRYKEGGVDFVSVHAGITEDEMLIPLIVIEK